MPFTVQELENIYNTTLDFHMKGVHAQSVQDKPLMKALLAKKKTFPGGKEYITERVKGEYTTEPMGFSHDDTVAYANPSNVKQTTWKWYEIHAGISFTGTEMKTNGITILDSNTGEKTSVKSQAEKIQLANLLEDKLDDMSEGWNIGYQNICWRDGTQDAKVFPGIQYVVVDDPTEAIVVGGIDQGINTWWRNRASLGIVANASVAADQVLTITLSQEYRQLRKKGGKPTHFFAGSDFLDQMEREMRNKGNYTDTGWAKNGGRMDVSAADPAFKGMAIEYDPSLDDLSRAKYGYWLDLSAGGIGLRVMDGEHMKSHAPSRPEDKYVFYRAMTDTVGLVARRRNSSGVYSIA